MNIARVPQTTTVPTAAATSWESASTMGCAAATALHPHMPLPVAISVVSASLSPSSRPPAKPRASVDATAYRSVSIPAVPIPRIAPKVTLAP